MTEAALARFGAAYAAHRAAEGRSHQGDELFSLPYLRSGPLARQWRVKARTFEAFMAKVVRPEAGRMRRPLTVLDLGAGNGWLSHRLAIEGHSAIAVDIRDDDVDGLGAAAPFLGDGPGAMQCLTADFETIPLDAATVDVAVFNASLHYALDLEAVLREAARVVRPGGRLAILDSPFYRRESDGAAMVAEKHSGAAAVFGERAEELTALPFIEFLTVDSLRQVSSSLGLNWRRRRVFYPLWYELRPFVAAVNRRRPPSRFDLWVSARP